MNGKLESNQRLEFEQFYLSHCDFLYSEAGKFFEHVADREDCVLTILVRLMDRADDFLQYSHERKLGFIHIAVRNYAIDCARREGRIIKQELNDTIADSSSVQDELLRKYDRELVRKGLRLVHKKYREVLELYYYSDMNAYQIAEQLHLQQSSVLTYLKRGRKELKEILIREGF